MLFLARNVRRLTVAVVWLLLLALLLAISEAKPSNEVFDAMRSAAAWLAQPFDVLTLKNAKAEIAAEWSLAAAGYALLGTWLTHLLLAAQRPRAGRRPRSVPFPM